MYEVADPGEPPYFSTKLRPEGPKNFFWRPAAPPPLCKGLDDRPPLLSQGLDRALVCHVIIP